MQIQKLGSPNNNIYKPKLADNSWQIVSQQKDVFFGNRRKTKYYEQTYVNSIENMDIENAVIKKPNILTQTCNSTSTVQSINNSNITNIKGFDNCILSITNNSTIKNAENFSYIILDSSSINTIKNTEHVKAKLGYLQDYNNLNTSKINYVNTGYLEAEELSEINEAYANSTNLATGVKIINLTTNKLSIIPPSPDIESILQKRVTIENANIILEPVNKFSLYSIFSKDEERGSANIKFAKINNLLCDRLYSTNSIINKANVRECKKIIRSRINELRTSDLKIIKSSQINKVITSSHEFIFNIDEKSTINTVEFEKPNGTLIIENNGNFIPNTNVINGTKEYILKNIKLDKFNIPKNLTAKNGVEINFLEVEEPNAVIKIIGNAKIDNIKFKNGGSVILEDDENGKHPDINNINVKNGEILKNFALKGLEKVAGMEELKQQLREDLIEPLKHPELYKKYGLDVINGFLMYGPPGCGKTFIAKQLAEETGRYLVEIKPSNTSSSYVHETAQQIARKFSEAKANKPSIVFIDEIEALAPVREGLGSDGTAVDINEQVTELLQQINNSKDSDIIVICASNEPQRIDKAIKRTGRLDKKIFVSNPDKITRKALFKQQLTNIYTEKNIDVELLAKNSEYYTAEDIRMVIRTAAIKAMKEDRPISQEDLVNSLNLVKPSLSKSLINEYYKKGEMQ